MIFQPHFFAYNDIIAAGALKGISCFAVACVPEDISIVDLMIRWYVR